MAEQGGQCVLARGGYVCVVSQCVRVLVTKMRMALEAGGIHDSMSATTSLICEVGGAGGWRQQLTQPSSLGQVLVTRCTHGSVGDPESSWR